MGSEACKTLKLGVWFDLKVGCVYERALKIEKKILNAMRYNYSEFEY